MVSNLVEMNVYSLKMLKVFFPNLQMLKYSYPVKHTKLL